MRHSEVAWSLHATHSEVAWSLHATHSEVGRSLLLVLEAVVLQGAPAAKWLKPLAKQRRGRAHHDAPVEAYGMRGDTLTPTHMGAPV